MSDKSSNQKTPLPSAAIELPEQWKNWKPDKKTSGAPSEKEPPALSAGDRAFLEYEPLPSAEVDHIWDWPDNDDGRAAFLLAHFGGILRYVPELKQWRVWHGNRWHIDNTGRAGHYCQILSRFELVASSALRKEGASGLAAEIEAAGGDSSAKPGKQFKAAVAEAEKESELRKRKARALGDEKTITALLSAAARTGRLIVPVKEWDADPWLVGTANGTLDLQTRTHRPGRPADHITKELAVAFDPEATAPGWVKFIDRILPVALADYVQQLAGYSLTGLTSDQAFYFAYGTGSNGKSILIESLAGLFGDYSAAASRNLFEIPHHGGDCKNDVAMLPGVRFLHGSENTNGGKLREEVIKSLTAGDTITGERKYCDQFSFRPMAKLWIMGNSKPRIDGTDDGIWRRVRPIPFAAKITEEEKTPQSVLMASLAAERPGILNWMLAGLAAAPTGIIPVPPVVKAAVEEYRQNEDLLGDFIEECTQDAADFYEESKHDVFNAYTKWAARNGIRHPVTLKAFTRRMGERDGWNLNIRRTKWMQKSVRPEAAA